jgi:hypothetical protein
MPDEQPFEAILSRRLHAIWEKAEALTLSISTADEGWIETRPNTAPHTLRKLADGFLEVAFELDAVAGDVAAEDRQFAERTAALGKSYAEAMSAFERDNLTKRLGEIVRAPHKPPEPTS